MSFTQACRSIAEPILDRPQSEISIARLLAQLFQITETFRMETQPQLLLLQKTMLVAEGTSRKLAPDANMWILIRPLIEDWMMDNLGPEAKVRDVIQSLTDAIERLPTMISDVEKTSRMISDGKIQLHPDTIRALRGEGSKRPQSVTGFMVRRLCATGRVCAGAVGLKTPSSSPELVSGPIIRPI